MESKRRRKNDYNCNRGGYSPYCNFKEFEEADKSALADDLVLDFLMECDYRVFNLETPLYNGDSPIKKCGPSLKAPEYTINGIKNVFNPSLLGICNNHIMDHGEEGFHSTVKVLRDNNIPFAGAGENIYEAQKPYIFKKDGKSVGIYFCAEHEFSIADEKVCGANPFEPLESLDHICELKKKCDYVIVLYHGGKEEYRYPTKNLQKRCRKMAEKGADIVICQHTHCIGCCEDYENSKIIYGQGNFLFNGHSNEFWDSGMIVKVIFDDEISVEYLPVGRTKTGIYAYEKSEKEKILQGYKLRSRDILLDGFIEESFRQYAKLRSKWYLYTLDGRKDEPGKTYDDYKWTRGSNETLALINYISCEPHNELLQVILNDMIK